MNVVSVLLREQKRKMVRMNGDSGSVMVLFVLQF